jgi:2-polyprenyl-6-methoxyphenol hydroxylase-like FAD-dependent oxidoreductase
VAASGTYPGHAVVVGGSMAGLLAARVLANHFEQVTLVERDALTDSAQTRKGSVALSECRQAQLWRGGAAFRW